MAPQPEVRLSAGRPTRMLQQGRGLFGILATSLVVVVLLTVRRLPPVVASHFDAAGVPNGWSSRPVYVLLVIGIGVVLPIGIVGLVGGLTRDGPERLNIPARDHWARPEHRLEAVRRVRALMWWLGCVMAGLALAIHGLVVAAHVHRPPRLSSPGVLLVLAVAVAAIGAWMVGWCRLLRRPSAGRPASRP